jgi:hypothetical protein
MPTLIDLIFEIERPYSKCAALLWLELHAAEGGVVSASADTLADKWGWSRSTVQRFLGGLAQDGHVGLKSGLKTGLDKNRRTPTVIELKWTDRGLIKSISSGTIVSPPGVVPPKGDIPPTEEGEVGKKPGGTCASTNPSQHLGQALKPQPPKLALVPDFGFDESKNLAFDGENMKVTKRDFDQMVKAYPQLNILGIIRGADKRYPRRQTKRLSPAEYLENTLEWKADEARQARVATERSSDDPAWMQKSYAHCDKRVWWRQEGAKQLRSGVWNAHLWGPFPWEERTECPVGTFSEEELGELQEEFNEEVARKVAEEEKRDAEIAKRRAIGSGYHPSPVLGRRP